MYTVDKEYVLRDLMNVYKMSEDSTVNLLLSVFETNRIFMT